MKTSELPKAARAAAGLAVFLAWVLSWGCTVRAECVDYGDYYRFSVGVDTPGVANDLVIEGDYAYIADGNSGLAIADVSDLSDLEIVGRLNIGQVDAVVVRGRWAYLPANASQFEVVDISDPMDPQLVGFMPWTWSASRIALLRDYAYVACKGDGLRVIDISSPTHPTVAGGVGDIDAADIVLCDRFAYVAGDDGLMVFDTSDAPNPRLLGIIPMLARKLAIKGDYAYVATYSDGLQIVDIRDPDHLAVVGHAGDWYPGSPRGVTVDGALAVVSANDLLGFDISDPGNPVDLGSIRLPASPRRAVIRDGLAFIADSGAGLYVVDVRRWDRISALGQVSLPDQSLGLAVAGGFAFVACWLAGLVVVDLTDPYAPEVVASVDTPDRALKVAVDDSHAYVADFESGLQIIYIGNPHAPVLHGSLDLPERVYDVAVSGDFAYLAADAFFHVVDVSLSCCPEVEGSLYLGGATCVAHSGRYAYVLGYGGLHVVDVLDAASPQLVSALAGVGGEDIVVVDGYAYVSGGNLAVVDVRDPSHPRLAAILPAGGWGKGVSVLENTAYLAGVPFGLMAVDIAKPSDPILLSKVDTAYTARDVVASGEFVYMSAGGFLVLPGRCESEGTGHPAGGVPIGDFRISISPNPSAGRGGIALSLGMVGAATVEIFDVAGRRVRCLSETMADRRPATVFWDRRDEGGHHVARGIYQVRATAPGVCRIARFVIVD